MARVTEEHIEARRRSILEAAARVFGECGIASATMADIAGAAGISAGAIYRYFPSKQDLAHACFKEGAAQIADLWGQRAAESPDPMAAFYSVAAQSFEELRTPEAAAHTRIMLENFLEVTRSGDQPLRDAANSEHRHIIRGLSAMLMAVQASGQLPAGIDTNHLGEALYAFWLGARIVRMLDPEFDTDAQLAAVSGLIDAAARPA
ncbi:MAG: TetR/AcrR family transcriptional regulator [Dehalococcoidia bacterium]